MVMPTKNWMLENDRETDTYDNIRRDVIFLVK
jgi:hypothetical protein